jgi:hypothetical protein
VARVARERHSTQKRGRDSRSELQRGQRLGRFVRVRVSNEKPQPRQRDGSRQSREPVLCKLRESFSSASGNTFSETPSSRES